MSVAIRTAVRIQDQDDAPSLGAGQDGYALTWDNASGAFVATALTAGVTDHGALTGLSDDDHAGYALLAGRSGGQTLYGGTAANDDITIHGTSHSTRTASYVLLQPSGGNVGIGTTAPTFKLHVKAPSTGARFMMEAETSGYNAEMNLQTVNGGSWAQYLSDGDGCLYWWGGGGNRMKLTAAGSLTLFSTTATTNALRNVLTLGANVTDTGVGAAGLGAAVLFQAESTTTANTTQARIAALWYEATHATFKSDLVGYASDAAGEREIWRGRGNGSAPAIGFLGANPAARIAHVADPAGGATVDAEARSAINSILATLESFGFHATS